MTTLQYGECDGERRRQDGVSEPEKPLTGWARLNPGRRLSQSKRRPKLESFTRLRKVERLLTAG
jgi:hypothetical protein